MEEKVKMYLARSIGEFDTKIFFSIGVPDVLNPDRKAAKYRNAKCNNIN